MSDELVALVQNPRRVQPPEMAVFMGVTPPYDPSRAAEESARLRLTLEQLGLSVVEPADVLRTLDRAALTRLALSAIEVEDEERRSRVGEALAVWNAEDLVQVILRQPRLHLRPDLRLALMSPDATYETYTVNPLFGLSFPRDHYVDLGGPVVIGRLRREDRRREVEVMRAVVERLRGQPAELVVGEPEYLEGGDVAAVGSVAVLSVDFRTTARSLALLWQLLRQRYGQVVCLHERLRRPSEFHLDHWLALGPGVALASRERLDDLAIVGCRTLEARDDPPSTAPPLRTLRHTLRSLGLRIVELSPPELAAFAANALFLPGTSTVVLADSAAGRPRRTLEELGFDTVTVPFDEHHRQLGSIHCAVNTLTPARGIRRGRPLDPGDEAYGYQRDGGID